MRARNNTRSYRKDEGTAQRDLHNQPTPFLGLTLAPLLALLAAWIVHYAIMGWTIRSWTVDGNPGFLGLAIVLTTLIAVGIGVAAWLPVLISGGPTRWVSIFSVLTVWGVPAMGPRPRLHVLRRDPREDGG